MVLGLTAVILSKIIFFQIKLLHAYVQYVYIVAAKHQFAPSKAVVVVDRTIRALSMHIQSCGRNRSAHEGTIYAYIRAL